MTSLLFAKPRPRALEKKDRARDLRDIDVLENQKVRHRSGGRCEIREVLRDGFVVRCSRKAYQTHHMLGGWGRRSRGDSAMAERKQHCCANCHGAITSHILNRVEGGVPCWTDTYRRAR